MKYNLQDRSSITNCVFSGEIGTSHWGNSGVTYSNNTFNTTKHGIYTIDAAFNVENSVFNGDDDYNGITLQYTSFGSAPDQSFISQNQFFGGRKGIEKIGGELTDSLEAAVIRDNIFMGQFKAIAFDGPGTSDLNNNDFTGNTWGNYITRLGQSRNLAQRNNYSNYDFGIAAYVDCSEFNFINNCFSQSNSENHSSPAVNVVGYGAQDVNQTIGKIQELIAVDNETAAGNCFEDYPGWDFFSLTGPTEEFTYYYKDETGCRRRPLLVPTVKVDNQEAENCTSNIGGPINTGFKCYLRVTTIEQISSKLTQLNDELLIANDSLQNSAYRSIQWYKWRLKIMQLKNCIKNLKKLLIKEYNNEKRYSELFSFASNENFETKSLVATQLIKSAEYAMATNYLGAIVTVGEEEANYVNSQFHLINKLVDGNYQLDSLSKNSLFTAAQKLHPLSAYSRSVYSFITGEYLDFHLEEETEIRNDQVSKSNLKIYPNPFDDQIRVENLKEDIYFSIFNVGGSIVKRGLLSTSQAIPTSDLADGFYFIILRDAKGNNIETTKLLKLK